MIFFFFLCAKFRKQMIDSATKAITLTRNVFVQPSKGISVKTSWVKLKFMEDIRAKIQSLAHRRLNLKSQGFSACSSSSSEQIRSRDQTFSGARSLLPPFFVAQVSDFALIHRIARALCCRSLIYPCRPRQCRLSCR